MSWLFWIRKLPFTRYSKYESTALPIVLSAPIHRRVLTSIWLPTCTQTNNSHELVERNTYLTSKFTEVEKQNGDMETPICTSTSKSARSSCESATPTATWARAVRRARSACRPWVDWARRTRRGTCRCPPSPSRRSRSTSSLFAGSLRRTASLSSSRMLHQTKRTQIKREYVMWFLMGPLCETKQIWYGIKQEGF